MDVGGRAASGTKAENTEDTKDIKMKQLTDLPISVFSVYSVVHIYFLKQLWLQLCRARTSVVQIGVRQRHLLKIA